MRRAVLLAGLALPLLVSCDKEVAAPAIRLHPVFRTVLTGNAASRPSLQINVLDESEHIFFRAELYLKVQSSRFPESTSIVIPVNGGDYAGCRERFVELPFEVEEGDVLAFNLLDDDRLSETDEQLILTACKTPGFCVLVGGAIYAPVAARIVAPVTDFAGDALGKAIIEDVQLHRFENYGIADYRVPADLPAEPREANELSIRTSSNRVPAVVKIYAPRE